MKMTMMIMNGEGDDDDCDCSDADADADANALEWVLAHSCVSHLDLDHQLQAHRAASRLDHVRLLLLFAQFEGRRIAEQMEGHTGRSSDLQVSARR